MTQTEEEVEEFLRQTPVPVLRGWTREMLENAFEIYQRSAPLYRFLVGAKDSPSFRPDLAADFGKLLENMGRTMAGYRGRTLNGIGREDLVDDAIIRIRGRYDFSQPLHHILGTTVVR